MAEQITLYGIPNCDTVKKTRQWFEKRQIPYVFHDLKKSGIDKDTLEMWVLEKGWEPLLNKRGTTFRELPDPLKKDLDGDKAIMLMNAHPTMIKRPVVTDGDEILIGYDSTGYEKMTGIDG
ncbi:arsenate reductase [Sphingomicrobium sp. XHP0235]|uniref:arsenate reductase n=1 Tax=Sphingomicrobium aquimarinum TaxID=3133971 RepID=UPI0031FF1072